MMFNYLFTIYSAKLRKIRDFLHGQNKKVHKKVALAATLPYTIPADTLKLLFEGGFLVAAGYLNRSDEFIGEPFLFRQFS